MFEQHPYIVIAALLAHRSTIIADAALATSAAVSTTDPFGGVVPSTTVAVQVTVTNPLGVRILSFYFFASPYELILSFVVFSQPAPPTTFVYTTIVGGVTQEVTDVYTPTYQPAVMSVSLRTGTIWAYSDYTALYGPTKASDSSSRRNLVSDSFGLISSIVAMAAGILVGVRVVGVL